MIRVNIEGVERITLNDFQEFKDHMGWLGLFWAGDGNIYSLVDHRLVGYWSIK